MIPKRSLTLQAVLLFGLAGILGWIGFDRLSSVVRGSANDQRFAPTFRPNIRARNDLKIDGMVTGLAAKLEQASHLPESGARLTEMKRLFALWAASDPAQAIEYLRKMRCGEEFLNGLGAVFEILVQTSPRRAVQFAVSLSQDCDRIGVYRVLFLELLGSHSGSACHCLDEIPVGGGREEAEAQLASLWSQQNFAAAFKWAVGLADPAARSRTVEATLNELADIDPLDAIHLAQQTLKGNEFCRVVLRAFEQLAADDPHDALALVSTLPLNLQLDATVVLARHIEIESFEEALKWVDTLPMGACRNFAQDHILIEWAETDMGAVKSYIATLTSNSARRAAEACVVGVLASADPYAAIDWVHRATPKDDLPFMLVVVADAWASRDPSAAMRWAADSLPERQLPEVLTHALATWASQDVPDVRGFVGGLPSELQLLAVNAAIPILTAVDPAATLAWARSLRSEPARYAAVESAYLQWLRDAPGPAAAWLKNSELPPSLKRLLPTEPPAT